MANDQRQIPDMPGLKIGAALSMLDQNKNLLLRLLVKFPGNHGSAAQQIRDALNHGDSELAYRTAHSLKSVAGSIGAYDLQKCAGQVINGIKKEQDIAIGLNVMEKEMQQILLSIEVIVNG